MSRTPRVHCTHTCMHTHTCTQTACPAAHTDSARSDHSRLLPKETQNLDLEENPEAWTLALRNYPLYFTKESTEAYRFSVQGSPVPSTGLHGISEVRGQDAGGKPDPHKGSWQRGPSWTRVRDASRDLLGIQHLVSLRVQFSSH